MRGSCCLVPRPQYSARPKRFGSRGPSEDLFLACSPRKRHRRELTERDWEHAVQRLGKGSCIRRPLGSRFPALTSLFWLCGWQEWSWFFDPRLIRLLGIWKRIKILHKISFCPIDIFQALGDHFTRMTLSYSAFLSYLSLICIRSVAWSLWQEIFRLVMDIPLPYLYLQHPRISITSHMAFHYLMNLALLQCKSCLK